MPRGTEGNVEDFKLYYRLLLTYLYKNWRTCRRS